MHKTGEMPNPNADVEYTPDNHPSLVHMKRSLFYTIYGILSLKYPVFKRLGACFVD
jgi:hypothetical protein